MERRDPGPLQLEGGFPRDFIGVHAVNVSGCKPLKKVGSLARQVMSYLRHAFLFIEDGKLNESAG